MTIRFAYDTLSAMSQVNKCYDVKKCKSKRKCNLKFG